MVHCKKCGMIIAGPNCGCTTILKKGQARFCEPKFVVVVMTIRMPITVLEKEGTTLDEIKAEFNGMKKELTEQVPLGADLKMEIHLE